VVMRMLRRAWEDERGFVVSTELVLIATVLVIGGIVGLVTVRDAVVQELGDIATAIGNINHSYSFDGVSGCTSATAGSEFLDQYDACEHFLGRDPPGQAPFGMSVQRAPIDEGEPLP
ncbi:MAG: hypothetical protein U1E05_20725, partial [Patescibacteria group bacterium]|nr:hypothetical protein [Patescibacteria group bacterium]